MTNAEEARREAYIPVRLFDRSLRPLLQSLKRFVTPAFGLLFNYFAGRKPLWPRQTR